MSTELYSLLANAPSQAHLQGTQADTQKPTLQKSLPCANAQATLYGWTQTHIVDDQGEGRTYNRGFAKIRADGILFLVLRQALSVIGYFNRNLIQK